MSFWYGIQLLDGLEKRLCDLGSNHCDLCGSESVGNDNEQGNRNTIPV